jgi:2,4-dienoyl-CoA reductase-like NADH-dependent reductase (Old Yellow Enzyme family)
LPNNELPVAASAISIKGKNLFGDDFEVPHALTVDEIKALVQDFVAAAKNALKAGFDGMLSGMGNHLLIRMYF